MITNVEEVKKKLKPYLKQYLEDMGVEINNSKMFQCINPQHNDTHPSMSIHGTADESLFYCHGCSAAGDIFTAAYFLENKPLGGQEFITENLQYLADKYGVPYELRQLTAEEKDGIVIKHLYSVVYDYITQNIVHHYDDLSEPVRKYIDENKLSEQVPIQEMDMASQTTEELNPYRRYGIGWVEDYDNLIDYLIGLGFEKSFIRKRADINRSIFNKNNLIFTLRNRHGSIVGFAGRNCMYDPSNKSSHKYINTSSSNTIYRKKDELYNLHNALRRSMKTGVIYLTEGYTDAIALDKGGLPAVALSGAYIHESHVQTLLSLSLTNIYIALDGDKAGKLGVEQAIVNVFSGVRQVNVNIIELDADEDPNSFILKNGIEGFLAIEPIPLFTWYLQALLSKENSDPNKVAEQVVPLIVNEFSHIERENMIKTLSKVTGISEYSIFNEVDRLDNIKRKSKEAEIANITDWVIKELSRHPANAYEIMTTSLADIENVQKKYEQDIMSVGEFIKRTQTLSQMQRSTTNMGYRLPGMGGLEKVLSGNWHGKSFFIGGEPNAGKTNFMVNLAMSLIRGNRSKVAILYHSTDDSAEDIITRFATYIIFELFKYEKATINAVEAPGYYAEKYDADFLRLHQKAYELLLILAKEGTLVVKDTQQGSTFSFAQRWIRQHKKEFPHKDIIYMADNFHNFSDFSDTMGHNSDTRSRIKKMANYVKNSIAVGLNVTTISTVEYRKSNNNSIYGSRQAQNERIAEAKTIEYAANFVGHLLNPLHSVGEDTDMYHIFNGIKYPIIELYIGKNKVSSNKTNLYYKHYQEGVLFRPIEKRDIIQRRDDDDDYHQ